MKSLSSREVVDHDRPIVEAFAERPGKPIRIRLHPMIFRLLGKGNGQYRAWRDVHWSLECDNPEEVFALREALEAFFRSVEREGPDVVRERLAAEEDAA
jgi:hypothetical protein